MGAKILVLGGMHGNEPLGIELVAQLTDRPIDGVDACLANPRAVQSGTRFSEEDLNRVFPGERSGSYERRRAATILTYTKRYGLVLDFHNTQADQPSCGFVGLTYERSLLATAANLGISRVIEAGYDCINKYAPNCLSVEISMRESDAARWYERLRSGTSKGAQELTLYRYLRRVTWDEQPKLEAKSWQPFVEIPVADKKRLSLTGSACPIFIGSTLTPYYATLVEQIKGSSATI